MSACHYSELHGAKTIYQEYNMLPTKLILRYNPNNLLNFC